MTDRPPITAPRVPARDPSPRRSRGLAVLAAVVVVLVVAAIAVAVAPAPADGDGDATPSPREPLAPGPPAPPTGVRGIAEPFAVRLRWDAEPGADVERYLVFRNGTEIAERAADLPGRLLDTEVAPGVRYVYAVVAVGRGELASGPSEVTLETPPASRAAARLGGAFDVVLRARSAPDAFDGRRERGGWTFRPACRRGACDVTVVRVFRGADPIELEKGAATYRARGRADLGIRCAGNAIRSTFALRVEVVRAATIDGVWRATAIEGTLRHRERSRPRCAAAGGTFEIRGRLVDVDPAGGAG